MSSCSPSHQDNNEPATWLGTAARSRPDAVALSAPSGRTLTYRELYVLARRLAGGLLTAGIGPGQPLVLEGLTAWETAVALHAGLLAGIPLFPVDPRLPHSHRRRLLEASGAWVRLTAEVSATEGLDTLTFAELEEAPPCSTIPRFSPEAPRLIVGTSGSSGPPKGVMLSGANLAAAVRASRSRLPVAAEDCWLACLPLTHIGGVSVLLRCAEAGATVRLHERFEAESVWSDLQAAVSTHLSLVPAMLARLLDVGGNTPPPRLRAALVGGGALAGSLRRRALAAGWPLYLSYGMSETASQISTRPAAERDDASVGQPLPGFDVRTEQACLAVRGPSVMLGYVNPELIPGDGLGDDGWFATRDLARIGEGGLTILGRADDVLVSGGEKVHPAEIERLLGGCPAIGEVGVSAAADLAWGERLVAFFTGPASPATVENWARDHLQGAWRPRRFEPLEALPFQRSGKLDRGRLRELAVSLRSAGSDGHDR